MPEAATPSRWPRSAAAALLIGLLGAMAWMPAAAGPGASEAPVLELSDLKESSGGPMSLRSGPLEVQVRVNQLKANGPHETDVVQPELRVLLDGQPVGRMVGAEHWGHPTGLVQIAQMDPASPLPEVLLSSFTGGAHCCNQIQVLRPTASGGAWQEVSLGPFNGGPAPASDPLGDGRWRIVDVDNRFLYRFGCYACSGAPLRIWQLQGDRFRDVSHEPAYRPLHQQHLLQMEDQLEEAGDMPNGVLAAYVATTALVGDLQAGWDRMLRSHDPDEDWGLSDCPQPLDQQGRCPVPEIRYGSYPEALRAFLVASGYISASEAAGLSLQRPGPSS
ncbi:hypothetical protein EVJ50_07350 [Synechococcus sp. RSCCF101]|uniref:hypothetical protein n=1 Tax=Synechococcus sp. RSCCF101 TaxID=2511069 RepID=UPI0012475E07|nr:hypothetical protein [Synechococcus sp. RSCCF101]QEY32077.1 hypothetical protein EVJ50_07350 [Synechococcus sp. RSCCF101]